MEQIRWETMPEMLTVEQAYQILKECAGIRNLKTVYELGKHGKIPYIILTGRMHRIPKKQLQLFLTGEWTEKSPRHLKAI